MGLRIFETAPRVFEAPLLFLGGFSGGVGRAGFIEMVIFAAETGVCK